MSGPRNSVLGSAKLKKTKRKRLVASMPYKENQKRWGGGKGTFGVLGGCSYLSRGKKWMWEGEGGT